MKKIHACLLLLVLLSGCGSTPYQPSGATGGFREMQINTDVWRVTFSGNGYTTRESVQTYWLYRSAELALEKGYDGFEILSNIQLVMPVSPEELFGTKNDFVPTKGGGGAPVYIPIYGGGGGMSHPRIEADILMLRKPIEGQPPRVFDARELRSTLEKHVFGQNCDEKTKTGNVCPHVHEYLFPKGKFEKQGI